MEGSYCGITGTSTRGTLSLRQTGGNRLKIAGVRACRHVFPGQRHKGMSEPRRAGHLPFPSLQGQALGTQGSPAGPAPAPAAPINANNPISGYGFCASRRGGHLQPQRLTAAARPGPSADNNSTTHDIHTALPIGRGNRRDEQPCGSRRCRCGEAQPRGDTPAPQGPRAALAAPPARSCALRTACRAPPKGPRMAGPPPLCPALPAGRQRGCCCLFGCCLPAGLLLPIRLLPTRLSPVTRPTVVTCRPRSLPPRPVPPPPARQPPVPARPCRLPCAYGPGC